MSFVSEFNSLPTESLHAASLRATAVDIRESLDKGRLELVDFAKLISPAARELMEEMCARSQSLTRQRFGKVIRLFAPLYLSNECVNNCKYCGFSRDNPILRVTLSVPDVVNESRALRAQGFRNLLLVAGEHPKFVSGNYMAECIRVLHDETPSISLEVGPMEVDEYKPLVQAGAEGLGVYQETYERPT